MTNLTQTGRPERRTSPLRGVLRARYAALPAEHGAWVFLFSPLLAGLAAGGLSRGSAPLVAAALAAFLIRQPVTLLVKIFSRRRPRKEMPAGLFWLGVYGLIGLAALAALVALGYGFLLWLAVSAAPVLAAHLWLVSRRAERRALWVELVASGTLALSAPAAYWVGQGAYLPDGWLLWGLLWLQVAGTILYAYLRLEQRALKEKPAPAESLRMALPALAYNWAVFLLALGLGLGGVVPRLVPLAFLVQPLETVWGTLYPAVGVKPKVIGLRQTAMSALFTLVMILTWLAG